ncbi:hypothetical protein K8R61_00030 [bacterium]|nr:hypothetical protein [bacterium]
MSEFYFNKSIFKLSAVFLLLFFISIFYVLNLEKVEYASAQTKDAVAIRVMSNPDHLSPSEWYLENVPNPGNPKVISIDKYEAVTDGRTVYVAASNVDLSNNIIYTNIYVMSYNEGASDDIINIFTQLVENWTFNSNLDNFGVCESALNSENVPCSSDFDCIITDPENQSIIDLGRCLAPKDKIARDTKRLADVAQLKRELLDYAISEKAYPSLAQGTYLARSSTSKWPSWEDVLSSDLSINLPNDPINRFYNDCSFAPGFHPDTCWNEVSKSFACPSGSFIYLYEAEGICSLHCDTNPIITCDTNSDCPNMATGEYCMKINAVAEVALNLETLEDTNILYDFNNLNTSIADDVCSDFFVYAQLPSPDINCCPPLSCSSMGNIGYNCGIYIDGCGQEINCGNCVLPERCIQGRCCVPNCAGKQCGDDGCGGNCGVCPLGTICDSNFACISNCVNVCNIGEPDKCNDNNWTQHCGECDSDTCSEWCDIQDCSLTNDTCIDGVCNCIDNCSGLGCHNINFPPLNSVEATGECCNVGEACYACDEYNYYFWDSNSSQCVHNCEVDCPTQIGNPGCRAESSVIDYGFANPVFTCCDRSLACFVCNDGFTWHNNACCEIDCEDKECGSDGCGGVCGVCIAPNQCIDDRCCDPNSQEVCNGIDDDCDGFIDEGDICIFDNNIDFNDGDGINIVPGQDWLEVEPVSTPYIWVASSGSDSVYRIDTATHALAGPFAVGDNPSRTSVALNGDVWVANRDSDNISHLDTNGNLIKTCAVREGPRGVAIDIEGNVWVANYQSPEGTVLKLDYDNCDILEMHSVGSGGYGAVIDGLNNVWVNSSNEPSRGLSKIRIYNGTIANYPKGTYVYGIAVDKNNYIWAANWNEGTVIKVNQYGVTVRTINLGMQCRAIAVDRNNNIWVTHTQNDKVTKLDNNGNVLFSVCTESTLDCNTTLGAQPIGITATADNFVWVINYNTHSACKLDPVDGHIIARVNVGLQPYTYSDMAGYMLRAITWGGSWTVNVDSHIPDPNWRMITWDEVEPGDSSARIRVRSADTEPSLDSAQWSYYDNNSPIDISSFAGHRWLQIQTDLKSSSNDESPTIDNLLIHF